MVGAGLFVELVNLFRNVNVYSARRELKLHIKMFQLRVLIDSHQVLIAVCVTVRHT